YLIALVVVIENVAVESERAIACGILRAEFEGIDVFGFEGQRMDREGNVDRTSAATRRREAAARIGVDEHRAGWIGAAGLIAMGERRVKQALIGEGKFGRPVHHC